VSHISQPPVSKKYTPEATKMVYVFSIPSGKQVVRLQNFLVSDFTRSTSGQSPTSAKTRLEATENFSVWRLRRVGWTHMEKRALIIIL